MFTIRRYEESDAGSVGRLIARTYGDFNLSFLPPDERGPFLGPFLHADSPEPGHREAIRAVVKAAMAYVAEDGGEIVGVLRGRRERLASLFVGADHHRQGIARALVERFEKDSIGLGVSVVRVAATFYAVPFYLAMGYKKSRGPHTGWSFQGRGLPVQPMKKILKKD